ncbi:uncharacterized protein LOC121467007 [Drosophila elegans]|uniref:uncharacterized protein LOC121467007 n=1 Tax=Drosophila elegans TaxID=30023 RepID=UPI001BC85E06|nr:uncharacterized protein LOC121467007 [Drosophila elegans]
MDISSVSKCPKRTVGLTLPEAEESIDVKQFIQLIPEAQQVHWKVPYLNTNHQLRRSPFRGIGGSSIPMHGKTSCSILFEDKYYELGVYDNPNLISPTALLLGRALFNYSIIYFFEKK